MGFVLSILYFVTYYLTPTTIFGPLAAFRVELVLAILVILISLPKLSGSMIFKTPQSAALIGLAIATSMSILIAVHWVSGAAQAFLLFIPCAFAYFLVCLHCNSKKRLRILVLMLLFVCVFVIAQGCRELIRGVPDGALQDPNYVNRSYLLAQQSDAGAWIYRLKGLGQINDPNDFGQVVVFLIPLVFILWRPKKVFRNTAFVLLPVSLLLFGAYLTHSRGALLGLMALVFVAARRRIGTVPALILGVCIFAASMAMHFSGGREISTEAGSDRTALWGEGLQILKSHPLFGVGLGEFSENCNGCGHTAHNSLVVCAAELGSFGLFFWCFFLFSTVRDALVLASPEKVSECEFIESEEESFPPGRGKREVIDKVEINRLGRLLLLSLTGFFVTGWFLSRAYVLTLFLLGGIVEVVYEAALKRGMVAPRLSLARTSVFSGGLAVTLLLLMYIMLRIMNLMH
jgi:O-antigen ligase